jgi:ABC-2 type transport system ATP-binding protein
MEMRSEGSVAVLWATHLCDEVSDADRVIVLHRGRILGCTSPDDLMASTQQPTIERAFLRLIGNPE